MYYTWEYIQKLPSIKLYAGDLVNDENYNGIIGLSLTQSDHRHINHDICDPLPLPDNSVDSYQAEDVFEHIEYDKLLPIINEIYRVLKPNVTFRLSMPDYGCDVLINRSVKDASGNIVFDHDGGGTPQDPGHVWFPRIDQVQQLLEKSSFGKFGKIEYLHFYNMDGTFVANKIDYSKGHIQRTPDFDERVQNPFRPMSMVIDLVKHDQKLREAIVLKEKGEELFKKGDVEMALTTFKKALEIDPNNRDAVLNYGNILTASGKIGNTRRLYSSYLQRNPEDEEVSKLFGGLQTVMAKTDSANRAKSNTRIISKVPLIINDVDIIYKKVMNVLNVLSDFQDHIQDQHKYSSGYTVSEKLKESCTLFRNILSNLHELQMKVEWGPYCNQELEWFDHYIDMYYQWGETINPLWLERGVFSSLILKEDDNILDLCCGDGFYSKYFYSLKVKSVLGIDVDQKAIAHAKRYNDAENITYNQTDILREFPSRNFDKIIWNAAIEHFREENIKVILHKIKEHLSSDSILSGYTIVELPSGRKSLKQHKREFRSKEDLRDILSSVFLKVKVIETIYSTRHNLYFWCSNGAALPFDQFDSSTVDAQTEKHAFMSNNHSKSKSVPLLNISSLSESYNKLWETKLRDIAWLKNDGKGRVEYCADLLRAHSNIGRDSKILDIGCGRGTLAHYLEPEVCLYGIDISEKAILEARKVYKQADVTDLNREKLPFEDEFFDLAITLDVIEHVFDPLFFLKEIHRVIKPGGEIILSTPNILNENLLKSFVHNRRFPKTSGDSFPYDGGHIHFFTYQDIFDLMKTVGFTFTPIGPLKDAFDYEFKEPMAWVSGKKI